MLIHWDDVAETAVDAGELRGRRRSLAAAAGAPRLGLSRYVIAPGERVMPMHVHADEEEFFVVLSGSGFSVEGDLSHPIAAGDATFHPLGGRPHTMIAGDDPLDLLAFGSGSDTNLTWLPRANVMWAGTRWIPLDGPNPFKAEIAAGPLERPPVAGERPATIVTIADLPPGDRHRGDVAHTTHDVGEAVGSVRSGLTRITVDPGARSNPPHCHSAEEELFVVVGGDGTLELMDHEGATTSEPVQTGTIVSRPPGTGLAHSFLAGSGGLTLLAHSDRQGADACFYPRSQKVAIRGLKVRFHVDRAGYWDGEE